MTERLVEDRWTKVRPNVMDKRVDTLRRRADYLAKRIERSNIGAQPDAEREYAALMWAIAELTGIGDEVRREKAEVLQVRAGAARRATKRAEAAEALNIQYRVKVAALKAEIHRLAGG